MMSDSLAQLAVAGFTVTVIALALSLLSLRRASSSVAIRRLDRVLLATFCMFLFVAWCSSNRGDARGKTAP